MDLRNTFGAFAAQVNRFCSSPAATAAAFLLVVVWAAFGPATHYSTTWQLIINTGTTIITFLMVFVLNNAQGRDTTAINAKLDSLIKSIAEADDRLVGMERRPVTEAEKILKSVERNENAEPS